MKKTYPTYEEAQRIVQEKGIKNAIEYSSWRNELGLPSSPHKYYKGKGWVDYYAFLGTQASPFPPYEEAQRIVQKKGINSQEKYKLVYKELGLPGNPYESYKNKGWTNWYDFIGKKGRPSFPTYEEAQRIVQEKGINTAVEYFSYFKELGLPSNPHYTYRGKGWIDWYDFLNKAFPTYEEAKRIVQEKGIKSQNEFRLFYKELGLPANPHDSYMGKGWINWYDFLGKPPKVSPDERKYRILTKLSISPILLQEDAPLQVIYILASQVDKKLAKKIESLLGTTSFEERLNWVKNQLKNLKGETTSIHKSLSSVPTDEVSAITSVMEEYYDVIASIPEDIKSQINTLLENYLHNAVNKVLISEYDG